MRKILATFAAMVVSGIATMAVAAIASMELGLLLFDNKDYFGRHPSLLWGIAATGFLAPGIMVWRMQMRGSPNAWKVAGTLALMVVSGVATYTVMFYAVSNWIGNDTAVFAWAIAVPATLGLTAAGFVAPGLIVLHFHRRERRLQDAPYPSARKGTAGRYGSQDRIQNGRDRHGYG